MALYTKCCIICSSPFSTTRIGSVYCSKKCRNKGRNLPAKMLQQLMERSAHTIIAHPTVPRSVTNFIRQHGAEVLKHAITSDPLVEAKESLDLLGIDKTDQTILLESAKKLQGKKNMDDLKKQRNPIAIDENLVDPEMMEMAGFGSHEPDKEMIAQQYVIPEDQLPVVETTEDKLEELLQKVRKPPQGAKTYKIKRFGG